MNPTPLFAAPLVATLLLCSPAAACDKPAYPIALDVGHDRTHPGATSARGTPEFDYNLALSALVLQALQAQGFTAAFRIGDTGASIALDARPARARAAHAALFISLHHDSAQKQFFSQWQYQSRTLPYSDDFHGYSIFISLASRQAAQNRAFATDLGRALRARALSPSLHHAAQIDGERRRLLNPDLGIYQFDQLAVLRGATMPALLLEAAVIVNRDEEQAIRAGALHPKIAAAIADAVTQLCNGAP